MTTRPTLSEERCRESVAKAMYAKFRKLYPGRKENTPSWDDLCEGDQNEWLVLADFAIAAMQQAVKEAGGKND